MEKLIELLGNIVRAIFSSKTLWLIIIAAAIFTLALLLLPKSILEYLGVWDFVNPDDDNPDASKSIREYIGVVAFASVALILARAAIWFVGLLKDQIFA